MDGLKMENPIKMDDLGVPLFVETSICFGGGEVETFHCTVQPRTGTLTLLKQLNVAETLESDVVAYGASVIEVINLWKVKQAICVVPLPDVI